ncbi:hypothetical protein [Palleniella muris]|nr:hypothetical protein [Palleniella muris]
MNTLTTNTTNAMPWRITDMYMTVLSSLSVDGKLDLIGKLTESIRNNTKVAKPVADDIFACFEGDWNDIWEHEV